MQTLKSLLAIPLCLFIGAPQALYAETCPEDYTEEMVEVRDPISGKLLNFPCSHKDGRREFFRFLEDDHYQIVTVTVRPDNSYLLSDGRILYPNGSPKRITKFNIHGDLLREERYDSEGRLAYKFVRGAGKLEIFNEDDERIKYCRINMDDGSLLNEFRYGDEELLVKEAFYLPSDEGGTIEKHEVSVLEDPDEEPLFQKFQGQGRAGKLILDANISDKLEVCFTNSQEKRLKGDYIYEGKIFRFPDEGVQAGRALRYISGEANEEDQEYFEELILKTD